MTVTFLARRTSSVASNPFFLAKASSLAGQGDELETKCKMMKDLVDRITALDETIRLLTEDLRYLSREERFNLRTAIRQRTIYIKQLQSISDSLPPCGTQTPQPNPRPQPVPTPSKTSEKQLDAPQQRVQVQPAPVVLPGLKPAPDWDLVYPNIPPPLQKFLSNPSFDSGWQLVPWAFTPQETNQGPITEQKLIDAAAEAAAKGAIMLLTIQVGAAVITIGVVGIKALAAAAGIAALVKGLAFAGAVVIGFSLASSDALASTPVTTTKTTPLTEAERQEIFKTLRGDGVKTLVFTSEITAENTALDNKLRATDATLWKFIYDPAQTLHVEKIFRDNPVLTKLYASDMTAFAQKFRDLSGRVPARKK